MKKQNNLFMKLAAVAVALLAISTPVFGHCDSMDGPVILQAQEALAHGDVTPVMKWVRPQDEAEIRQVFDQVMKVRSLGKEAAALADRHFFETLVRIHREGEGAPYTGLRPAGELEPIYVKADAALADGSVDHLATHLGEEVTKAIATRFAQAKEKREMAESDVANGREFVEAYVAYMHFVEAVYGMLSHGAGHGSASGH